MVGSAGLKLLTQVPGLGQCLAAEGQRVASRLWGWDRGRPDCGGLDLCRLPRKVLDGEKRELPV